MSKVSIVIPIYNMEYKLSRCLESIINQSYSNLEIILINDGSTDNSGQICDDYAEKDSRITVNHSPNMGVSYARNIGIDIASGEYLIFIDSDDYVKLNMLEEMVSHIKASNCDVLISGLIIVQNGFEKEITPPKNGKKSLEAWKYICENTEGLFGYVPNKLYKLEIIKSNQIYFDINRKIQEDLDFALKVFSKCKSFLLLDKSYYFYEYEMKNRVPDLIGYMEIEINKRNILKELNIFDRYKNIHSNKLADMIFCYLYWCDLDILNFPNECNKLYSLDRLNESLDIYSVVGIEKKIIVFLLRNKCLHAIRIYFLIRRYLVRIIKK